LLSLEERIKLIDVHLYSSEIVRDSDITAKKYPDDMLQQQKLSASAELLESENKDNILIIKPSFAVRFISGDEANTSQLAMITAEFLATYKCDKEYSSAEIKDFINDHAINDLWPFWREFSFRMSSEANLPKPMLSAINTRKLIIE
jgi:hypothetical protein